MVDEEGEFDYENRYKIIRCYSTGEHAGMCKVKIQSKRSGRIYPGENFLEKSLAYRFSRESPIKDKGE